MPAPKSSASSLLTAGLGIVGFSALAGLLAAVMVAPAVAVGGITTNNTVGIFDSLPDYITLSQQREANEIVATNPDGTPFHIATVFDQNRQSVALDQMSDYLKEAAVAGEDRRYYQHGGIDIPSVARAAIGGGQAGGASTITMQLVRNIRFQEASALPQNTPELKKQREAAIKAAVYPDLGRKVQEMKLAIGLEKKYSKQDILAAYLNIVGMGGNTYGVEAAAQQYYSTSSANLSIAQAASLIAIVQNPSTRGLFTDKNYDANKQRRDVILGFMKSEHYITQDQYSQAVNTPVASYIKLSTPKQGCYNATPGFQFVCQMVIDKVNNGQMTMLGGNETQQKAAWARGGYTVTTSISPNIQNEANATLAKYAPADLTSFALGGAATTVQVGTGRILVMAQNKPFDNTYHPEDNGLDQLTQSKRPYTAINFNIDKATYPDSGSGGYQPGSSYKPYTLLSFLAAGHGVNEVFNASVRNFNQSQFRDSCPDAQGGWVGSYSNVKNDENEQGPRTVVNGTAGSINTVFLQMATKVDQCDTEKIAESLGVHNATTWDGKTPGLDKGSTTLATRPTCVLGGCENNLTPLMQAAAYAAIANQGVFCKPILIDQVTQTESGEKLGGENAQCGQDPLISPDVANTAAYAMAAVFVGGGTARYANPNDGSTYIGKTGTTNDSIHTWTVGSSTKASTALWVGNIVGTQQLRKISVPTGAGRIQAANLRNNIFKAIAQEVDAAPGLAGGKFPAPAKELLDGAKTTVPSGLVGGSVAAAQAALNAAGLTYQDGGQVDSDLPAGTVASLSPGEGAQVVQGAVVSVTTSNGLAKPVPDVTGQDEKTAKSMLQAAGFSNVTTACTPWSGPTDPDAGKVVSQSPDGNSSANPANAVTITVKQQHC
ncbi:transglycosylase domain-containing protein [Pseudolysinimonas sp.]|uniref:transglycosylase domain-containing protein n=1 Tax=Pseudolysinimonas sp. TaxID=2680009 RepID=UPI003F805248